MKKFFEKAIVSKVDAYAQGLERDIILRLEKQDKSVTATDMPITLEAFNYESSDIIVGRVYRVPLVLVWFELKENQPKEKAFKYIKSTPTAVNKYNISGEVVMSKGKINVVDCGFFVYITGKELKKGDFIWAEGRLDVFFKEKIK